jgi:hypothetical protein
VRRGQRRRQPGQLLCFYRAAGDLQGAATLVLHRHAGVGAETRHEAVIESEAAEGKLQKRRLASFNPGSKDAGGRVGGTAPDATRIHHLHRRTPAGQFPGDCAADDACTDDSEQVTRSFEDPRVVWINRAENAGIQSGPNNTGLDSAKGKYVAFLGHDDLWHPWHLAFLVGALERSGRAWGHTLAEVMAAARIHLDFSSIPTKKVELFFTVSGVTGWKPFGVDSDLNATFNAAGVTEVEGFSIKNLITDVTGQLEEIALQAEDNLASAFTITVAWGTIELITGKTSLEALLAAKHVYDAGSHLRAYAMLAESLVRG